MPAALFYDLQKSTPPELPSIRLCCYNYHNPTSICIMPVSSSLADAGLVPLYPFGATSAARGVSYYFAVQSRSNPCSPSGLRRAPLAHPTDWPICGAISTYKWILRLLPPMNAHA